MCVNWHLQNSARKLIKYTDIKDGDMVRCNIKEKTIMLAKSHEPKMDFNKTYMSKMDNHLESCLSKMEFNIEPTSTICSHEPTWSSTRHKVVGPATGNL